MCWHVYTYFSQYSQNLTSCSNSKTIVTLIQVPKGGESFTHCWVEWEIHAKLSKLIL